MNHRGDDPAAQKAEVRQIITMVRWLLYLVFAGLGLMVLIRLGPVLTPVFAAAGVAYLLDGWVDLLERRGLRRSVAVGVLLFAFIALVVAVVVFVVPLMSDEIADFVTALPSMVERATRWVSKHFGYQVPQDWRTYLESGDVQDLLKSAAGPLSDAAAAAVGGAFSFLTFMAEFLLVPVFAFYFLADWDHLTAKLHALVPPRHRDRVGEIAGEIDAAVSSWIRGQFTVVFILAALYATSFRIIGIHLGIILGLVVGLLTIIPFLGTFVGACLTMLMVVLDWHGAGTLLAVGVVFVCFHLLEAAVLTPKLVGKKVGLGEVGALLAVLAGGELLGFFGVLLAVPIAASIAVLIRRAVRMYEKSSFFTDGAAPAPAAPLATPAEQESK